MKEKLKKIGKIFLITISAVCCLLMLFMLGRDILQDDWKGAVLYTLLFFVNFKAFLAVFEVKTD